MRHSILLKYWHIYRNWLAGLFSAISILLTFYSWEDFGFNDLCSKTIIIVSLFIFVAIVSVLCVCFFNKEHVWERGPGSLSVIYGDIMRIGFKKSFFQRRTPRLIVIPVNTHFDTIVEPPSPQALVSSSTIHGKWVSHFLEKEGINANILQSRIYASLDSQHIGYDTIDRERGGNRCYTQGSCALIQGRNEVYFVLLAISDFNESNNAHTNKECLISNIKSLLFFLDSVGQGAECFIPLMGTGLSRAGLTHKDSLHLILSTIDLYNERVNSPLNIVIYKGDKSKVSIFDR